MPLQLASSAFHDGGEIPARYTCDGLNVSRISKAPLRWALAADWQTPLLLQTLCLRYRAAGHAASNQGASRAVMAGHLLAQTELMPTYLKHRQ